MARYIDADALLKSMQRRYDEICDTYGYHDLYASGYDDAVDAVENAPTADVEPRAEWISVEDRLPDIDPYGKGRYGGARSVRVLCACKQRSGRTFAKEGYYEPCGNGKVFWRIPGSVDSVTHWMPLPEPPEES